ncbi:GNAT family protein [Actinoplanes sp. NPDC049316]|uniref:GNAT family N-acetyltransferase n=1 Tax=Actinoplanes sp. NPDC049316 TaxID=3154727 RepID=UPI003449B877
MLITTDRLVLRRFRLEDAAALAAYRSIPEVARYQSWSTPYSLDKARYAVQTMVAADPTMPGWFQYAVELPDGPGGGLGGGVAGGLSGDFAGGLAGGGKLIGDVGVNLADNLMQAEIGYTLRPDQQGHGYATESVRAVLDHLFRVQRLHRVSAECDARNVRSARLLERVGFTREGLRRQHTWIKHEWTDDLLYGLLAEEWPTPH